MSNMVAKQQINNDRSGQVTRDRHMAGYAAGKQL